MEENRGSYIPSIGEQAPEFHATTTQGELHFPQDYHGSWVVLFSYQADFTPVSTSEIMVLASTISDFKALGIEIIGLATDSVYSHIAWMRKLKELSWKDIKHVEVTFPIIADVSKEIANKYGMLHLNYSTIQTISAVYIINPEGKIASILFYPVTIGRNINEIKRMVTALQKVECEKIMTPANWQPEEDVILSPPETCSTASELVEMVDGEQYCLDWFMCFRQSKIETKNQRIVPEVNPYPSMYPVRNRYRYQR